MGSNPSCLCRTELVHSQTPPIWAWPASRPPLPVTGAGCHCCSPTLAPARSIKSPPLFLGRDSSSPGPAARDGGVSSTPSFERWLCDVDVSLRPAYEGRPGVQNPPSRRLGLPGSTNSPIHRRHLPRQLPVSRVLLEHLGVLVDASGLFKGWDPATHPHRAAG